MLARMADNTPPFAPGSPTGSDPGPIGADGPFRDVTQGAAPGGLFPSESELPIRAWHGAGAPATTSGYSPDGEQPPLPPAGSDQGSGLPPSGMRR